MSTELTVVQGDIAAQHVDVIVNAANESLLGGGGVDGAIHRAAGPELLNECRAIGGCAAGQAVMTRAYLLPARWIVHTVGPVWVDGRHGEPDVLANCYRNSLDLAVGAGACSIAFPSISTGAFGYPVEQAAAVAVHTVAEWLSANRTVCEIRFVCFDHRTYAAYQRASGAMAAGAAPTDSLNPHPQEVTDCD